MKEAVYELTPEQQQQSILWLSTLNFTLIFAVWLMFGVLGIPIRKEFGLTDVQFAWLTAIPILNGAIWRLSFGIWADRFGGKKVLTALMVFAAIPTFFVTFAHNYLELMIAAFLSVLRAIAFRWEFRGTRHGSPKSAKVLRWVCLAQATLVRRSPNWWPLRCYSAIQNDQHKNISSDP